MEEYPFVIPMELHPRGEKDGDELGLLGNEAEQVNRKLVQVILHARKDIEDIPEASRSACNTCGVISRPNKDIMHRDDCVSLAAIWLIEWAEIEVPVEEGE